MRLSNFKESGKLLYSAGTAKILCDACRSFNNFTPKGARL